MPELMARQSSWFWLILLLAKRTSLSSEMNSHDGARDVDVLGITNIEGISVVTTFSITSNVVHGDLVNSEALALVDAHQLDRRILEVQASDG